MRLTRILTALTVASFAASLPAAPPLHLTTPTVKLPELSAVTRNGETVTLDREPASNDVIVEFIDPPLAEKARTTASALQSYRDTFARFRRDIAGDPRSQAAATRAIHREYCEAFNGVAMTADRNLVATIARLPYVRRVMPDVRVHAYGDPAVTKLGADRIWNELSTRGKGIIVAVIDTGIDYTHPALGGAMGPGHKVIGGHDFVNNDDDPIDDNSHGTHVAGIIAGETEGFRGIAPDVSLVAYKVLDEGGSGKESDIMAAIERTMDPNGDGDFSDRIDVANMSLGGSGNPDDPMSQAVDRAVAKGVIFCIAAGNSAQFHTIGSPGVARDAITVGASDDNDKLASFSSKGPSAKNAAIKPDVLAPGVNIRSSIRGGKYAAFSGTSMATPHITGLAALILALHRDWTPAQVKAALSSTAELIGQEVMAQGSGRANGFNAATATDAVKPASISFGLNAATTGHWQQSQTITITNSGSTSQRYDVTAMSTFNGLTVAVNPASFQLAGGQSQDVSLSVDVANDGFDDPKAGSLALSGTVQIKSQRGATHVPWAFVKAARATVTFEGNDYPSVFAVNNDRMIVFRDFVADHTLETFMPSGTYDLFVMSGGSNPGEDAVPMAIVQENKSLSGEIALTLSAADAPHKIAFAGTDETGKKLIDYDRPGALLFHAIRQRLVFPAGSFLSSLELPFNTFKSTSSAMSDISERFTLIGAELLLDMPIHEAWSVQFQPLKGIKSDVTMNGGGSDLSTNDVLIHLPPGVQQGGAAYLWQSLSRSTSSLSMQFLGYDDIRSTDRWTGRLHLTPDVSTESAFGVAVDISAQLADGQWSVPVATPPMHVSGGKLYATWGISPAPTDTELLRDRPVEFGEGPLYPWLYTFVFPLSLQSSTSMVGMNNEFRGYEAQKSGWTAFGPSGDVLARGDLSAFSWTVPTTTPGRYRIETIVPFSLGRIAATATSEFTFDPGVEMQPPNISTYLVLDGAKQPAWSFPAHGSATLVFSAADYNLTPTSYTYSPPDRARTKAFYRLRGASEWLSLAITEVSEDKDTFQNTGHDPLGVIYRADLTDVMNIESGAIDVRIEIADAAGNTIRWSLEPSLVVGNYGSAPPVRRRGSK